VSDAEGDQAVAGTVLAFDYGERYIGVAVGDAKLRVAHPLVTIDAPTSTTRFAALAALFDEWQPVRIVVGLPLRLAGERHEVTRRAERFARQLEGRFRVPVSLIDERLSSVEAAERLRAIGRGGRKTKQEIQAVSAQVILQDYFERHATA
jgi:putative Holliday junction resolvase